MKQVNDVKDFNFENYIAGLNIASGENRKEFWQMFQDYGWPTRKQELWKYSAITPDLNTPYISDENSIDSVEGIANKENTNNRFVFINGFLSGSDNDSESNINIKNMEDDSEFYELMKSQTSFKEHGPSALSLAVANHVYVVEVNESCQLQLDYISSTVDNISNNLIFFKVAKNVTFKLIENYYSSENSKGVNLFSHLYNLADDCTVDHYQNYQFSDQEKSFYRNVVICGKSSVYNSNICALGGGFIRSDLAVLLQNERSSTNLLGLFVLDNNQHMDFHSFIDHQVPHCRSNQIYRGVLGGSSKGVFNGKLFVKPDAQDSRAEQSNKNLLLSKNAEMNTKPELEIYADDVTAAHGATIGQLNEESLFYLKSRGLKEIDAQVMLTESFVAEVYEKFEDESFKTLAQKNVKAKCALMPAFGQVKG